MNKAGREYKLSQKLVLSAVLAFILSTVLFAALQYIAQRLIHSYCTQTSVISGQLEKKAGELQRYISNYKVSLEDTGYLEQWVEKEQLTDIAVYRDGRLLYSSFTVFPELPLPQKAQSLGAARQNGYQLSFRDGNATVFISDLFEHRYYDYATYLNLAIFFLTFLSIMVAFIRRKVAYIGMLVREIRILEGGNLAYAITAEGDDELAALAQEIDEMRKAFIAREQDADRMRAATSELMADISHDLRTPLTALIGYLEVMEGESAPAKESPFLPKCKNRALQLKSLIGNLFEYVYISTAGPEQLQFAVYPLNGPFGGILREHILLMEQYGFAVANQVSLPDANIRTELGLLQRIFDNLLSNIQRYADPGCPVVVKSIAEPGNLTLIMENRISDSGSHLKKTGIGLKNCERMMELHRGKVNYEEQGVRYTVELCFPIIES